MVCTVLFLLLAGTGEEELPPLSDLDRFPPLAVCQQWIAFHDDLHWRMTCLQKRHPADAAEYEVLRAECAVNRTDWVILRLAMDEGESDTSRREFLMKLRRRIGWQAYCAGYIEPVPVQYFRLR